MTGKDLFDATEFLGEDLIHGAEFDRVRPGPWRKLLPTAAVLTLLAGGGLWLCHTLDVLPPSRTVSPEEAVVMAAPATREGMVYKTESRFGLTMEVPEPLAEDLHPDWSDVMRFCFLDGNSTVQRNTLGCAEPTSIVWFLSVSNRTPDQSPAEFYDWGLYPRDLLLGWDDSHFYTLHRPGHQMEDEASYANHQQAGLGMLRDFLDRNDITPAPDWETHYCEDSGDLTPPRNSFPEGQKPTLRMERQYHLLLEVPADLHDSVISNEEEGQIFSFYDRGSSMPVWTIWAVSKEEYRSMTDAQQLLFPAYNRMLGDDRDRFYLLGLPQDEGIDPAASAAASYGRSRVWGYHLLRGFLWDNRINPNPEWEWLYFEAEPGFDHLSGFYELAAKILDADIVDRLHELRPMMEVLPTEPLPQFIIRSKLDHAAVEMVFDPYDPALPLRQITLTNLQEHLLLPQYRAAAQEAAVWWLQQLFPDSSMELSETGIPVDGVITCTFRTVLHPKGISYSVPNPFDAIHISVDEKTGSLAGLRVSAYPCVNLRDTPPLSDSQAVSRLRQQSDPATDFTTELTVEVPDPNTPESYLVWNISCHTPNNDQIVILDAYTGQLIRQYTKNPGS